MIVDLRRLDDNSGNLSEQHDIRFHDAFGDEAVVSCDVEIDYQQTGGACYLNGTLHGDYRTRCHGCLEDVDVPVDGEFIVVIRRSGHHDSQTGEDGEAEYIVIALGEHEVDLGPAIHENFVVNIPMLIMCREDCKGLCPTCGINLNHQTCNCAAPADPRWNALRSLGDQQRGK